MKNTKNRPLNANGRSLKPGPIEGPAIIQDWLIGGKLRFACAIAEPSRAPANVQRLIETLRQRQREIRRTACRLFGVPALLERRRDQVILAKRRRLVGTRALRDDRTARRLVQGDSRAATVAVGAA